MLRQRMYPADLPRLAPAPAVELLLLITDISNKTTTLFINDIIFIYLFAKHNQKYTRKQISHKI